MGNIIEIRDNNNTLIAKASHGLPCASYVGMICRKYKPDFNLFFGNINEQLKEVYSKATIDDEIVVYVFMNDHTKFDESDIPGFEIAIENYPDNINQGPKNVLIKYLELLKKHGVLDTKMVGVSAAMTLQGMAGDANVIEV